MSERDQEAVYQQQSQRDHVVTVADVMVEVEERAARSDMARFLPLPTGFHPLDDVFSGGLQPGELMIVGGTFGAGRTVCPRAPGGREGAALGGRGHG